MAAILLTPLLVIGILVTLPRLGQDPGEALAARSPLLGGMAPAFSLPGVLSARRVSSAGFEGHFAVVYFFASWCPPCVEEVPNLLSFYSAWHNKGVDLVGIGYGETRADLAAFARRWGIIWPLAFDPADQEALAYGVFGIPETFVLAPQRQIVAKLVGPLRRGELSGVLARLAGGAGPIYSRQGRLWQGPPTSGVSSGG